MNKSFNVEDRQSTFESKHHVRDGRQCNATFIIQQQFSLNAGNASKHILVFKRWFYKPNGTEFKSQRLLMYQSISKYQ